MTIFSGSFSGDGISEEHELEKLFSIDDNISNSPEDDYRPNKRRPLEFVQINNSNLLEAVKNCNAAEVQSFLDEDLTYRANSNATYRKEYISACHIAAFFDNDILSILLKHGADKHRTDRLGRTPLHVAAWSGHVRHVAALLEFPEELQKILENGKITTEIEEEIKKLPNIPELKDIVDAKCYLECQNQEVPDHWVEYKWRDPWHENFQTSRVNHIPTLQAGWTPLHAAASNAQSQCFRVLVAAGADPNIQDRDGRTPFKVAEYVTRANEVTKMLLTCNRSFTQNSRLDTPLHTAVELESLEAIQLLRKAGLSPRNLNNAGLTPLHLCVEKRLYQYLQDFIYCDLSNTQKREPGIVDLEDKEGNTVLHYAVLKHWTAGVCLALKAEANILIPAINGEMPIHTAAALGYLDVLKEIVVRAKLNNVIDVLNLKKKTALLKSIINGHKDCVLILVKEGASIEVTLPNGNNMFQVAAELGHLEVLKVLLEFNQTFTKEQINKITSGACGQFGPIHLATMNGHIECVQLLLKHEADISLKTAIDNNNDSSFPWEPSDILYCNYEWENNYEKGSTPLHIAAEKNYVEIAEVILKSDPSTYKNVNAKGWTPLHIASHYGSNDVVRVLINYGADLAECTADKQTSIDIIINNSSKPTEFIESIFDKYIITEQQINESTKLNTTVLVDYRILKPTSPAKNLVIDALLKTSNSCDQRRLLNHPLVESFVCIQWEIMRSIGYIMLLLYGVFATVLTIFVMAEYYCTDNKIVLDNTYWTFALYFTIVLILLKESIYISASLKLYLHQLESWVKLISILLAFIFPILLHAYPSPPVEAIDWPRHIATAAVLLCWLEMTLFLSRFPSWGYYVQMFGRVSMNMVKILFTFTFLIISFVLSFMIQNHHQPPFDNFWPAFVKTMVMMTSEFEYANLGEEMITNKISQSLVMIRIVFLIFMILVSIVLMNLMIGVAIEEIRDLEVKAHIMRLERQVEFLASLETLVHNKVFHKLFSWKYDHIILNVALYPWKYKSIEYIMMKSNGKLSRSNSRSYSFSFKLNIPTHVRDAIFEKVIAQKNLVHQISNGDTQGTQNNTDDHTTVPAITEKNNTQIDEFNAKVEKMLQSFTYNDQMKIKMDELSAKVDKMVNDTDQMKTHMDIMNSKVDKMVTDTDQMKTQMDTFNAKVNTKLQLVTDKMVKKIDELYVKQDKALQLVTDADQMKLQMDELNVKVDKKLHLVTDTDRIMTMLHELNAKVDKML